MEPVSPHDIDACLRVLARAASDPADPALASVRRAVDLAYRSVKKERRTARRVDRREHDLALVATATRYRDEVPPTVVRSVPAGTADRATTPGDAPRTSLRGTRRCYVCKATYQHLDVEYHMLCPTCAAENTVRRHARCDLTGRRTLVTGGRVKIGFHTALKLLRDGAEVLVTTRFPRDAARRFAVVADAADWTDRLWIHGVDFLDLPGVLGLVETVRDRWGTLDILVNNAAQTIARPPAYHREVRAAELAPLQGGAAAIAISGSAAPASRAMPAERHDQAGLTTPPVRDHQATPVTPAKRARPATVGLGVDLLGWFPAGERDETGEPLDLRPHNSWVMRVDEVSPREWLEVQVVNAFVPFLLTGHLKPLMLRSPHPDRYVVQVSAMEGSFARERKTARHPHTNMAKAGLNMLTRTVADEYAAEGIYVSSVDTGWVTDERPHASKQEHRAGGFRPPLDVIDGAARVYDPIVRGVSGEPVYGVFLKDYRRVPW